MQSAIIKFLLLLKCAFAAIVTAVSVIPFEILAKVFPVQGAKIKASSGIFGPKGSAPSIVWITFLLQRFSTFSIKSLAFAKSFDYNAHCEFLKSFLGNGALSMIELDKKEKKGYNNRIRNIFGGKHGKLRFTF